MSKRQGSKRKQTLPKEEYERKRKVWYQRKRLLWGDKNRRERVEWGIGVRDRDRFILPFTCGSTTKNDNLRHYGDIAEKVRYKDRYTVWFKNKSFKINIRYLPTLRTYDSVILNHFWVVSDRSYTYHRGTSPQTFFKTEYQENRGHLGQDIYTESDYKIRGNYTLLCNPLSITFPFSLERQTMKKIFSVSLKNFSV